MFGPVLGRSGLAPLVDGIYVGNITPANFVPLALGSAVTPLLAGVPPAAALPPVSVARAGAGVRLVEAAVGATPLPAGGDGVHADKSKVTPVKVPTRRRRDRRESGR
jgi:hypothetical protein